MKTVSKNITVPCLILFVIVYYLWGIKSAVQYSRSRSNNTLIIGILSAPTNFEQRLSIRNTWLKLASNLSVEYHFLIGNKYCDVHPLDRKNSNSCDETDVSLPRGATSKTTFKTIKRLDNPRAIKTVDSAIGFGFYPLFEIIITDLGITAKILKTVKSPVRVKLKSSFDKTTFAAVTFSPIANETMIDFVTKKIRPIQLPVHYEAFVVLEMVDANTVIEDCKEYTWNTQPGVVDIVQIFKKPYEKPWLFTNDSCSHVFMNYLVPGLDDVQRHISLKSTRRKEWKDFNEKLAVLIKRETMKHNDIMFLDLLEVYENLTEKMLQFYKRLTEKNNYQFILKTDDDTFIDLLRVYRNLKILSNKEKNMWWWSHFRECWRIGGSGKWRDDKYRSVSYPPFPCGGGYVINRNIVNYIVQNLNSLERFQGEDVSLGIWLGGMSVIRYQPKRLSGNHVQEFILDKYYKRNEYKFLMLRQCPNFQMAVDGCQWTCDNNREGDLHLCNKVQLSVREMYETWEDFTSRGFL